MKTLLKAIAVTSVVLPVAAVAQNAPTTNALTKASSSVTRSISGVYTAPVGARAVLTHDVKARDLHVGQAVSARVTSDVKLPDGTFVARNSTILGVVSSVVTVSGQHSTRIGLSFDRVRTVSGAVIPVRATLIKVASPFVPADSAVPYLDANAPMPSWLKDNQNTHYSGKLERESSSVLLAQDTQLQFALSPAPELQASAQ